MSILSPAVNQCETWFIIGCDKKMGLPGVPRLAPFFHKKVAIAQTLRLLIAQQAARWLRRQETHLIRKSRIVFLLRRHRFSFF
ncbi:MAG: hypothetical protein V1489_01920 [Candidatus Liptonbacteria bacterium]